MKNSEELLKIFKTKLKKYSTREVIKTFSSFDRDYFRNFEKITEPPELIIHKTNKKVFIMPWLFNEIIFYSTDNNDFKQSITADEAWELYIHYANYFNATEGEFSEKNFDDNSNNLFAIIFYGHQQDQAIYQVSQYMFINRFNRNYYLLSEQSFESINLSSIVKEKYQTDLTTFVQYLAVITYFSINGNYSLNSNYFLNYIDDERAYQNVLDDLSVSYYDCRDNPDKKIFKIKPIIHTTFNEYFVPSIFTMFYNIGDKIYWLLKDKLNHSNIFVHKFGEIFENYIYKILVKQYGDNNVEKIPCVKNEKSADFIIRSKNYIVLFEIKSGVARAGAKQTNLNINDLNFYIKNNIVDAMKQLDASAKIYKDYRTIICFIINYDTIFTEDSLIIEISEKYSPKYYELNKLVLFGIDYFENFIYKYNDLDKLDKVFLECLDNKKLTSHQLIEDCFTPQNYFYKDIFNEEVEKFIAKHKKG